SHPGVADGRACYESPPWVILRDTERLVMLAWECRFAPVPASLGMREVVKGSHGLDAIHTHPAGASAAPPGNTDRHLRVWCRPCWCIISLPAGQARPQGRAG